MLLLKEKTATVNMLQDFVNALNAKSKSFSTKNKPADKRGVYIGYRSLVKQNKPAYFFSKLCRMEILGAM